MKSALVIVVAAVACAVALTTTPCLAQRSLLAEAVAVGGESSAKAKGPGGFAKGGNFHCKDKGCNADNTGSDSYMEKRTSHSGGYVAGPYARGEGAAMASTNEIGGMADRTAVRSQADGDGLVASFADALITVNASDVRRPDAGSYSFIQGYGQATGVGSSFIAQKSAYTALGGVKGTSGFPNVAQPAAALVADVRSQKEAGGDTLLTSDVYFSGVGPLDGRDQSYGLGYVGQVPAQGQQNDPQVLASAGGIGVASGHATYKHGSSKALAKSSRGARSYASAKGAQESCSQYNLHANCGDVKPAGIPSYIERDPFAAIQHP